MDRRVSDPLASGGSSAAPAAIASPPQVSLTLRSRTQRGAFELWRETVAPAFVPVLAEGRTIDAFAVDFRAYFFGRLGISDTRTSAQTFDRDATTIARSGLDHFMMHLSVVGRSLVEIAGRHLIIEPGDVWIYDMARPLVTRSEDIVDIALAVPRDLVEPLVGDVDGLHGRKFAAATATAALLRAHLGALLAAAPRLVRAPSDRVSTRTAHLVAGALGPRSEAVPEVADAVAQVTLTRVLREIERHLGDPGLGPELLQRRFGLSRATLYRLFEPLGGVSDHIRRLRLDRCLVDLARPGNAGLAIGDFAMKWGFGSEATFHLCFRDRFGITPSDVRSGGLAGGAHFPGDGPTTKPEPDALRHWLNDMVRG